MKINYISIVLLFLLSNNISGQVSSLVSEGDIIEVSSNITSKKSNGDYNTLIDTAKKAGLKQTKIDSLIFANESYLFLKNQSEQNAKSRNELYHLYAINNVDEGIGLLSSYREEISTILSKDEFFKLYKDIIEFKIQKEINKEIGVISQEYIVDNSSKKKLAKFLYPFKKEACLLAEYYGYNTSLSTLKFIEYNESIERDIDNQVKDLGLVYNQQSSVKTNSYKEQLFIEKATRVGIDKSTINDIVSRIRILNKKLDKARAASTIPSSEHLYLIDDEEYHTSRLIDNFEEYLVSQLSIKQYKELFWDQFEIRVKIAAQTRYRELDNLYNLSPYSREEKRVLYKWILNYVAKEEVTRKYYGFAKSLASTKANAVKLAADKKYREVLLKMKDKPVTLKNPELRVKRFMDNAKVQGVDKSKAMKIVKASIGYEQKMNDLMNTKKYDTKNIYTLETDYNSKNRIKEKFKRYVAKTITEDEFKKLFWDQIKPEVDAKTKSKLKKIQKVYSLGGENYKIISDMVYKEMIQEATAKLYYGYDKKLAKQKVKALQFKFDKEYKSKIKELVN